MDWAQLIIAIVGGAVSGLFTGGMAWGAIRRDVVWLIEERRRHEADIVALAREISELSRDIGRLYGRIDKTGVKQC